MEGFNFSQTIQLRWNDMDALGHVNNAIYISYFEVARGTYINAACKGWDWYKNIFLIANVNVDYHKELLLTAQNVKVHARTSQMGTKSFTVEYALTSEIDGKEVLHATGSTVQIMFDPKSRKTIKMEDWIKQALTAFDESARA